MKSITEKMNDVIKAELADKPYITLDRDNILTTARDGSIQIVNNLTDDATLVNPDYLYDIIARYHND